MILAKVPADDEVDPEFKQNERNQDDEELARIEAAVP
jgi:hypothetical protein